MLPDTFFSFLPIQASYLNLTWRLIVHTPDDPTLKHISSVVPNFFFARTELQMVEPNLDFWPNRTISLEPGQNGPILG